MLNYSRIMCIFEKNINSSSLLFRIINYVSTKYIYFYYMIWYLRKIECNFSFNWHKMTWY